jgi:tRNA A-37 threonylcarbamoyl transferase component Bud32
MVKKINFLEKDFDVYKFKARKDLLHFAEELNPQLFEYLKTDFESGYEELKEISKIAKVDIGFIHGYNFPPKKNDPNITEINQDVFLYRGDNTTLNGLWVKLKEGERKDESWIDDSQKERFLWKQGRLGPSVNLRIYKEYSKINPESLLPENFEKNATLVKKEKGDKRPIYKYKIDDLDIFIKGAYITPTFSYEIPKGRLTRLVHLSKVSSKKELDMTQELKKAKINVPKIIGYYEGPIEEFLFMEEVKGKQPNEYFKTHKELIIKEDATMLANMCLAGYRKSGFCDFDDKIFDGKKLYLIDVEECRDYYSDLAIDFRSILLNPLDKSKVKEFRKDQIIQFNSTLKDALYIYKDNLIQTLYEKQLYVDTFYDVMKWKKPNMEKMMEITSFPKNYMTFDAYIAMMTDC